MTRALLWSLVSSTAVTITIGLLLTVLSLAPVLGSVVRPGCVVVP